MDWLKEAEEVNSICKEKIKDWEAKKFCGPNFLIIGNNFDDDIIVYKNLFSNKIFLDQLEPVSSLSELKVQLEKILKGIEEYERKN